MIHLTRRQRDVLEVFADSQSNGSIVASLGEAARKLGLSKSTVYEHVLKLESKGLVDRIERDHDKQFQSRPWSVSIEGLRRVGRTPARASNALVELCDAWDRATAYQRRTFIELRAAPWAREQQ